MLERVFLNCIFRWKSGHLSTWFYINQKTTDHTFSQKIRYKCVWIEKKFCSLYNKTSHIYPDICETVFYFSNSFKNYFSDLNRWYKNRILVRDYRVEQTGISEWKEVVLLTPSDLSAELNSSCGRNCYIIGLWRMNKRCSMDGARKSGTRDRKKTRKVCTAPPGPYNRRH